MGTYFLGSTNFPCHSFSTFFLPMLDNKQKGFIIMSDTGSSDTGSETSTLTEQQLEESKHVLMNSLKSAFTTIAALKAANLSLTEVLATASFMKALMERLLQLAVKRNEMSQQHADYTTASFSDTIKSVVDKIPDEEFITSIVGSGPCTCAKCAVNNQDNQFLNMILEAIKSGNVTLLQPTNLASDNTKAAKKEYLN